MTKYTMSKMRNGEMEKISDECKHFRRGCKEDKVFFFIISKCI